MELSTYFRINAANTGQFERTLIIAEEGSHVSYLEGCTAPMRDENQLHAAVVELVALDNAQIKYSTVQNWYPGDEQRPRRHLQLRHQARRLPRRELEDLVDAGRDRLGDHLEVSELHSARRQFRRRVLLRGASTNNYQQADTGTKMIHIGRNTRSTIVSKGISAGHGQNTLSRPGEDAAKGATARATSRSAIRCCSARSAARTRFPYIEVEQPLGARRARGDDVEDRRGPDCSTASSAASRRGRRQHDRERLLQAKCSGNCRWSSPSRRRSCLNVSLEGAVG